MLFIFIEMSHNYFGLKGNVMQFGTLEVGVKQLVFTCGAVLALNVVVLIILARMFIKQTNVKIVINFTVLYDTHEFFKGKDHPVCILQSFDVVVEIRYP